MNQNITIPRNEDLKDLPVTTYGGFVLWYDLNPKSRQTSFDKIGNLKEALEGRDPISYLYTLYFEDKKSLDEILRIDTIASIDFLSRASLHRILFKYLHWEARPKTERTPVHEKQLDQQIQSKITTFERKVSSLLKDRTIERVFSMSEFQEKTYRIQKALYILNTLGGINKDILYTLCHSGGLENATIAHALNNELTKILKLFPNQEINLDEIKLYPQSIARWFQYQYRKREKQ